MSQKARFPIHTVIYNKGIKSKNVELGNPELKFHKKLYMIVYSFYADLKKKKILVHFQNCM